MAGRLVTIAAKQTYTFNVTANQSTSIWLGPRVIASPEVVSGMLLVRVAALTLLSGNIKIGMSNTMLMPDDPSSLYYAASSDPLVSAAEVSIQYNDTITSPGRLYPKGFTAGTLGAMFSVYLNVNQGATGGAGSITCSIDAVLRDA